MTTQEIYQQRKEWLTLHSSYQLTYWKEFNYKLLANIMYSKRRGRGSNHTVSDAIIMADTETSKKIGSTHNHVVAWTISIRAFDMNIVTLYGRTPSDFCRCIKNISNNMGAYEVIFYFHNLAYDWVFLRKFLIKSMGVPLKQLNTRPHYPILIQWGNGITFKDSLILAQRSIEKWAIDLNAEHQKAVGKWDYDKLRNQDSPLNSEELEYIEHDTLAGVECLNILLNSLNKVAIYSMPYTATGIPREAVRKLGAERPNKAREKFKKQSLSLLQYIEATQVFHGGYTHGNRYLIDVLIDILVECYDFSSSYPFVMLSEKFPCERFTSLDNKSIEYILEHGADYAFMFKLILIKPKLKDLHNSMPALQFSKCINTINAITDNGRILEADYVEIYLNEVDLSIIAEQYTSDGHIATDIQVARKDYLPRWFTDYIFSLFVQKTKLKGGDPVLYALAKAILNSVYGMCVQRSIRESIDENYDTGEYIPRTDQDINQLYEEYLSNRRSILPYQWGVWVTSYAFRNLFQLGRCCSTWVYSDTDSCYGIGWDKDAIKRYNEGCKAKLQANGYGCVKHNDREYWLGVAEYDGAYSEFKVLGAKRYAGRDAATGKLKITVAGVPKKKGATCLNDDINNFTNGFIFNGKLTGKLTHTYQYIDSIYVDSNGNETGDSIDLTPCDYLLDSVKVNFDYLDEEVLNIPIYSMEDYNYEA